MQIGPLNRIDLSELGNSLSHSQQDPPPARELVRAVKALNQSNLFGDKRELSFRFDADTRRLVIRIVERESGDVFQEIPSEEVLRMMAAMEKNRAKGGS